MELFRLELRKQTEFALMAINDLDYIITNITNGDFTCNMSRAWYSIQAFLVATANVSKIFWPDPKKSKYQTRGLALRKEYKITEDSALNTKKMRNVFEHYDEKLDDFKNKHGKGYWDSNIGPINMIGNATASDYMRHYDPTEQTIIFRGMIYKIQPAVHELIRINQLIR